MSANIGWLFYKDYFKGLDFHNLKSDGNKKFINQKVKNIIATSIEPEVDETIGNVHFQATTTYPGLLLGSGYTHELPSIEGQAILGFDFDYTTGLPIIRGSSIKGVLRSAFGHQEYIKELLHNQDIDISSLEAEIFDNGDIFFDALIISDGKILADDYLAPHKDNPLANPIPLRFIKVAPNVTFMFDFYLKDGSITKNEKSKLFQAILEDLGLGAKSNVGYGKLENFKIYKTQQEIEQEAKELQKQKELEAKRKEEEEKRRKEEKAKNAKNALNQLESCKDIKQAMKILNDNLGKKPKLTPEQQEIINNFWQKNKNRASKSEIKFFKKYGVE
jgi:CRISPR-associated protein Cmr6